MPIPTCLTFTTGTTTRVHSPRPPESAVERQVNRVTAVSQNMYHPCTNTTVNSGKQRGTAVNTKCALTR